MPKPAEIIASLSDLSAIDSYATLRAEMVDLFADVADRMTDERIVLFMRRMAATIETVPYDVLVEFGHSYSPTLIALMVLNSLDGDTLDCVDAHDYVLTLLQQLRNIDLDHPDTPAALEQAEAILRSLKAAE